MNIKNKDIMNTIGATITNVKLKIDDLNWMDFKNYDQSHWN